MDEIWKPIKGYEGLYEVSNLGRIKSLYSGKKNVGGILRCKNHNAGYVAASLSKDKKKKYPLVHKLVAEVFIEKVHGKEYINHKNGNKKDNHVDNLEWCTQSENMTHACKTGLLVVINRRKGEQVHSCKLSDKQIEEIRSMKGLMHPEKLSEIYGVSKGHIWKILGNRARS